MQSVRPISRGIVCVEAASAGELGRDTVRGWFGRRLKLDGRMRGRVVDVVARFSGRRLMVDGVVFEDALTGRVTFQQTGMPEPDGAHDLIARSRPFESGALDDEGRVHLSRDVIGRRVLDRPARRMRVVGDLLFARDGAECFVDKVDFGLRLPAPFTWGEKLLRPIERLLHGCPEVDFDTVLVPHLCRAGIVDPRVLDLDPSEAAILVGELEVSERLALLTKGEEQKSLEILEALPSLMRRELLRVMGPTRLAEMARWSSPGRVIALLSIAGPAFIQRVVEASEPAAAKRLGFLLATRTDHAGAFCSDARFVMSDRASVAEALEAIRTEPPAVRDNPAIFVVDSDRRLVGLVRASCLCCARPEALLTEIAPLAPLVANADDPVSQVDLELRRRGMDLLPVVERDGVLVGQIGRRDVEVLRRVYFGGFDVPEGWAY